MLKNKLESLCLSIVNVKYPLKPGFKDAQYSKKTLQEPLKNQVSETAGEASVGLIAMNVDSVPQFKRQARCQVRTGRSLL